MNQVNCTKCGEHFTIKPKEKKHGQGIKETYFTCPSCKERYTAFVTDAEIRRKQREIKRIGDQLHTITDVNKYQRTFNKYKQLQENLEPLMKQLKNKIQAKALN